jgi:hypothetical protein
MPQSILMGAISRKIRPPNDEVVAIGSINRIFCMRITLRIDDDLHSALKERALREEISLGDLINRLIRIALATSADAEPSQRRYHQETHHMGLPLVYLTKALSLAGQLEDEEIIKKVRGLKESH